MNGGDDMQGINMNSPVAYYYSSMRYFKEGEKHVTRYCAEDVLLLVYDGILRFSEDGVDYEVYPGNYFIQRKGFYQAGKTPSDSPKYFYTHFSADWCDSGAVIPKEGIYDVQEMMPLMVELDAMYHGSYSVVECTAKFLEIMSKLYRGAIAATTAGQIADYIGKNFLNGLTLESIAQKFHFSKNHVINIFKKEYGMTPFDYIGMLRVRKSEWLLEVTGKPAQVIAYECGFNNYSHFYKTFRHINGISPTEWREIKRVKPLSVAGSGGHT